MGKTKTQTALVEEMLEAIEKDRVALQKLLFDLKWDPHPHISKTVEKNIEERSKENKNKFCPYCGKRLAREDPPLRKLDGDISGLLTPDKPFTPHRTVKTIDEMDADTRHTIRENPEGFMECLRMRDSEGDRSSLDVSALTRKNHSSFHGLNADNPDKPCRAMREGTPLCGDLPGMAPEGKCYFDHQKDCNAGCSAWEGDEDNDKVRNISEI